MPDAIESAPASAEPQIADVAESPVVDAAVVEAPAVAAEAPAPVVEVAVAPVDEPVVEEAPVAAVAAETLEDRVPVGTIVERTAAGWKVSLMYGGAPRLFGDGASIRAAFAAVGL